MASQPSTRCARRAVKVANSATTSLLSATRRLARRHSLFVYILNQNNSTGSYLFRVEPWRIQQLNKEGSRLGSFTLPLVHPLTEFTLCDLLSCHCDTFHLCRVFLSQLPLTSHKYDRPQFRSAAEAWYQSRDIRDYGRSTLGEPKIICITRSRRPTIQRQGQRKRPHVVTDQGIPQET